MKSIQLQLQMAKELGVYNDDGIGHVNKLKGKYSVLLRELRKRKQVNKRRRILQKFNILGCTSSFKSKVLFFFVCNVYYVYLLKCYIILVLTI